MLLADSAASDALLVAERMRAAVEALGAEIGIPIELSVGIADVETGSSAVHIVSIADQRMYEHKNDHSDAELSQLVRPQSDASRP